MPTKWWLSVGETAIANPRGPNRTTTSVDSLGGCHVGWKVGVFQTNAVGSRPVGGGDGGRGGRWARGRGEGEGSATKETTRVISGISSRPPSSSHGVQVQEAQGFTALPLFCPSLVAGLPAFRQLAPSAQLRANFPLHPACRVLISARTHVLQFRPLYISRSSSREEAFEERPSA